MTDDPMKDISKFCEKMSPNDYTVTLYGWPILVITGALVLLVLSLHIQMNKVDRNVNSVRREMREVKEREQERHQERMRIQINDMHSHSHSHR